MTSGSLRPHYWLSAGRARPRRDDRRGAAAGLFAVAQVGRFSAATAKDWGTTPTARRPRRCRPPTCSLGALQRVVVTSPACLDDSAAAGASGFNKRPARATSRCRGAPSPVHVGHLRGATPPPTVMASWSPRAWRHSRSIAPWPRHLRAGRRTFFRRGRLLLPALG